MKTKILISFLLVANVSMFADEIFSIVTDANGGSSITVVDNGDGTLTLTPEPSTGYSFWRWSDDSEQNTANPRIVSKSANQDDAFVALFKRDALNPSGGSVEVTFNTPTDYTDPNTFSFHFVASANTEAAGHSCDLFEMWSDGSTDLEYDYVLADCEILPSFYTPKMKGDLSKEVNGTIEFTDGTCQATLTAKPNEGYLFYQWTDDSEDKYSATRVVEYTETSYSALFIPDHVITFNLGAHPASGAEVPATAHGYQLEAPVVAAADHYKFEGWSDVQNATSSNVTFPYYCEKTLYAAYSPISYNVTFNVDGKADAISATTGTIETPITLPSVTNVVEGYEFLGWKVNGEGEILSASEYTPLADVEMVGQFKDNAKARLDGNPYNDLTTAMADATDGATLEILMDLTDNLVVPAISITVKGNDKTLTGDIAIANGGSIDLQSELIATNLYLASQAGSSSQILNADKLTITGSAYIDITLEPNAATASSSRWYAIAVPFDVNTENGVFDTNNQPQVCETNVRFAQWNGDARATSGTGFQYPYCGTLEAGKLYMMTINGSNNVWRFKAKESFAEITELELTAFGDESTAIENKGWNAISNPSLSYAKVSDAEGYAYLYHSETNDYTAQDLADCSFVMGSPFVVQVATDKKITFTPDATDMLHAPKQGNEDAIRYVVTMTDGKTTDYLYLTAHTDAEDQYVIGRDLGKMRSNVPQLWTTAYNDVELAAQDALLTDNEIFYALTLSMPKAGKVTLSANRIENADLYLMQNGYPICQLSEMPYELNLNKGLTKDLYFIVSPKAPLNPTNCDKIKDGNQVIKFMIDSKMYINYNGKIYNVLGGLVK